MAGDVGFDVPMEFSIIMAKRLLLGSRPRTNDDLNALRYGYGAAAILNVCEEDDALLLKPGQTWAQLGVTYKWLPVADDGMDKPASWWEEGIDFIDDALGCVAVHCVNGIQRSASLVFGWLRVCGFSHRQADLIIRVARPIDILGIRYADNFERLYAAGEIT